MSKTVAFFLVALVAVGAVVFSLSARGSDAPSLIPVPPTFEYRLIAPREGANPMPGAEATPVRDFLGAIQRAGVDGWELVAFDANGGAWLKRRK